MRILQKYWWHLVALVAAIIVLAFGRFDSSLLPSDIQMYCQQGGQAHEQYCPAYGIVFAFLAGLKTYETAIAAIATAFIAYFTYTLKRSTDNLWIAAEQQRVDAKTASDRQFEITQQSIKLAREEFVSTHRPKIILREAIIGSVLEGEPISVHFHLANIGETTGTIIRSMVRTEIVPRQARLLLHGSVETQYDLGEIILGPGMAILLKFNGDTPKWNAALLQEKSYMGAYGNPIVYRDATIHFFGQLIYVDQSGIWRRTAFRRYLIPERQRFYRIPDEPDLDYGD